MIIGFTGTQLGMTDNQRMNVLARLALYEPDEVHHGDCIGADEAFHHMCEHLKKRPQIHVHPPSDSRKRAYCEGDVIHPPLPYLTRNKHIVAASDLLIATPFTAHEIQRSGTWSTIRRARRKGIEVVIL